MKKLLILASMPILLLAGCKKDLTSINVDPKSPTLAPASSFFIAAQKAFTDAQTTSDYNFNIFPLIVQYWQETIYLNESQYNLVDRNVARNVWTPYYRDVIRPLREAKKLAANELIIPTSVTENAIAQKNQIAIAEIMEIYTWYYLVTTFGDIPYSEALDINKPSPKYDDQKTIYNDLLTRLDAAISQLDPSGISYESADVFYHGDVTQWQKFANSVKLKMGMTIADFDNTKAQELVEEAVTDGVLTSNADNAIFHYQVGRPHDNPIYDFFITQRRRGDIVAATTIVNKMNALNDPRRNDYFREAAAGGYIGGKPGEASSYTNLSRPNANLIVDPTAPATVLSYAEVEFFLAEAVERGYNVGGTAEGHYNNAVTASIEEWGGTATEAAAYLAQPDVNYATAAPTWQEKIGIQKWISLYMRGWDAWTEWRRLDYPQLTPATNAVSAIPVRYTYPIPEQNVNKANYDAASSAIGGDAVTTKLFWDKF